MVDTESRTRGEPLTITGTDRLIASIRRIRREATNDERTFEDRLIMHVRQVEVAVKNMITFVIEALTTALMTLNMSEIRTLAFDHGIDIECFGEGLSKWELCNKLANVIYRDGDAWEAFTDVRSILQHSEK